MSGGDPICAIELIPIDGDIPIPILAVVDMLELLLTPSRESKTRKNEKLTFLYFEIPITFRNFRFLENILEKYLIVVSM